MRWPLAVAIATLAGCRSAPGHDPSVAPVATPERVEPVEDTATPGRVEPAPPPGSPAGYDKNLIRRVVRSHLEDVRLCYNEGLAGDPGLGGRVVLQFGIGPEGTVTKVVIVSSDPEAGDFVPGCIAAGLQTWRFPAPSGGGSVVVTYPFLLQPGRPVTSPSGLVQGEQREGVWFEATGFRPGIVIVEVLDERRRPAAGVEVLLSISTADRAVDRRVITGADGRAEFTELPAGASIMAVVEPDVRSESITLRGRALGVIMVLGAADE